MRDAADEADTSDARLIDRFRHGDTQAAELLFRRHAALLRRVAARWVRRPAERDDLVAEAFTCVFAVLRAGGGTPENLCAYLVLTMRALHTRWTRHHEPEETDALMLRHTTDEVVASALRSLPPRWRTLLRSTVADGHTATELAPVLGVSRTEISAMTFRAREALRLAYLHRQPRRLPTPREEPSPDATHGPARPDSPGTT
ncbi:RNA polymerase sigma factor, sigma-70 family [Amycolatopsis xylanica]|uniref:RNA polymerase sigma factor, sigma-70 family n=1 Tax=Amycolatopsis xylanica TaxID=589385 RepID=A0A1H3SCC2_9PSEU|nr:sigma-70 family RNA polymerase sigma factor [Amycolatopsis xylanica]SDZ35181.1 RNA polymerase sigma factor, sigma-70 family [Amycolatopsis xylanica]